MNHAATVGRSGSIVSGFNCTDKSRIVGRTKSELAVMAAADPGIPPGRGVTAPAPNIPPTNFANPLLADPRIADTCTSSLDIIPMANPARCRLFCIADGHRSGPGYAYLIDGYRYPDFGHGYYDRILAKYLLFCRFFAKQQCYTGQDSNVTNPFNITINPLWNFF